MCAPSLIEEVRRHLTRRRFLGAIGGTLAAATTADLAGAQTRPVRLARGFRTVHDLTHVY